MFLQIEPAKELVQKSFEVSFGMGVLASMLVAVGYMIIVMYKYQTAERKRYEDAQEKHNEALVQVIKENNLALKSIELTLQANTSVIEVFMNNKK